MSESCCQQIQKYRWSSCQELPKMISSGNGLNSIHAHHLLILPLSWLTPFIEMAFFYCMLTICLLDCSIKLKLQNLHQWKWKWRFEKFLKFDRCHECKLVNEKLMGRWGFFSTMTQTTLHEIWNVCENT